MIAVMVIMMMKKEMMIMPTNTITVFCFPTAVPDTLATLNFDTAAMDVAAMDVKLVLP